MIQRENGARTASDPTVAELPIDDEVTHLREWGTYGIHALPAVVRSDAAAMDPTTTRSRSPLGVQFGQHWIGGQWVSGLAEQLAKRDQHRVQLIARSSLSRHDHAPTPRDERV